MLIDISLLVLGFILLIKGADWLVDGASSLAKKYNISDLAIGLTIVAFGTSAPELVVNAFASINQHQGIIFGNVIGSNNFNLLAILGIAGLISPLIVQSSTVWKEIPLSFAAACIVLILCNSFFGEQEPVLSRADAIILLLLFAGFLYYVYRQFQSEPSEVKQDIKPMSPARIWIYIILGLAGLIFGGRFVVDSAIAIASDFGVSETVIGLTIVAAGTSLPELATSVVAALKKNNDIAVGNVVGSNVFNLLFILGVSALIRPIPFDTVFNEDLYVLCAGTIFLFICMFVGRKHVLHKWQAGLLLVAFIGYTIFLLNR